MNSISSKQIAGSLQHLTPPRSGQEGWKGARPSFVAAPLPLAHQQEEQTLIFNTLPLPRREQFPKHPGSAKRQRKGCAAGSAAEELSGLSKQLVREARDHTRLKEMTALGAVISAARGTTLHGICAGRCPARGTHLQRYRHQMCSAGSS